MLRVLLFILSWGMGLMHPLMAEMVPMDLDHGLPHKRSLSRSELVRIVQTSIRVANPREDWMSDREVGSLARELIETSQCYGIDPLVFTALIWRESAFRIGAVSKTGAVGLTQMTKRAIQEVLERTAENSPRMTPSLRKLVGYCNPGFLSQVGKTVSHDDVLKWRLDLGESTEHSMVMGAILFKLNLQSIKPSRKIRSDVDVYVKALERYNGDPEVKIQFAKDVLSLSHRLLNPVKIVLNDSKFLSRSAGL